MIIFFVIVLILDLDQVLLKYIIYIPIFFYKEFSTSIKNISSIIIGSKSKVFFKLLSLTLIIKFFFFSF